MQFTCQQDRLSRGLSMVGHAVAKGSISHPILANIRLEATASHLKLQATNLEIGITVLIEAEEVQEEGVTAVPAKLFTDIVSTLPPGSLTMHVYEATHEARITSQRGNARVRGTSPEEFPPVPGVEQGSQPVVMNAVQLKEVIKEVSIAADYSGAREVLESVLVQIEPEKVTFAAADGFRLAFRTISLPVSCAVHSNILIPVRTLLELSSILPTDGVVQMSLAPNNSQVIFHTERMSLSSRLLEGKFPNYRAMLPAERQTRAVMKTAEFIEIVRLTALFARASTKVACLTIRGSQGLEPGSLTIASEESDLGGNVNTIPAAVEGDDQEVAFNVEFLAEALAVTSSPEVALEIGVTRAPGALLRPVGTGTCVHFFLAMGTGNTQSGNQQNGQTAQ